MSDERLPGLCMMTDERSLWKHSKDKQGLIESVLDRFDEISDVYSSCF